LVFIDRHHDLSNDHAITECHDASTRLKLGVSDETWHEASVKLADVAKCRPSGIRGSCCRDDLLDADSMTSVDWLAEHIGVKIGNRTDRLSWLNGSVDGLGCS
jgi:hypothetical protein